MNRIDAILFSIAFYMYLAGFLGYIAHVAFRREWPGRRATTLMTIAVLPHSVAIAARWITQGHVPLANMYEYMGLMSWMVVVSLIFFVYRYRKHSIGVFIAPVAIMLLVTASLLPSDVNRSLMPALQSTWLAIHVTLAALGSGAFLIAFAASALYLLSDEQEKTIRKRVLDDERKLFILSWIGIPLFVMLLLLILDLLPTPIEDVQQAGFLGLEGRPFTAFAVELGGQAFHWGRMAIGLGIGMIFGAIVWPILHKSTLRKKSELHAGSKFFVVVVIALLFSAVIVGFLIKSGAVRLTPRSPYKIFEFFGPTLLVSWVLSPVLFSLLLRQGQGWIARLDLARPVFEDVAYTSVAVGYPLYTVGALFAGAIWAEQAWGTWWSWDPKEVGALIIWIFYTGFLHARFQKQWKHERAAVLIVLGMVMVFISFFGNYFFGGLHAFEVT